MKRFTLFIPFALVVFACAQADTTEFGEGGSGGSDGDGGAPNKSTSSSSTSKATTGGGSTTNTTAGNTTSSTSGPTTTNTTGPTTVATTTTSGGGCGPTELDCGDGTCFDVFFELCNGAQDCANGFDEDPAICGGTGVPPGWTCDPSYYNTVDGCDCGCGELDPDCPSASSADCEYCASGCSMSSCPGTIDPNDNSQCL